MRNRLYKITQAATFWIALATLSPLAAVWEQSTKAALGKATEYVNSSWTNGGSYKGQTENNGTIAGLGILKWSSGQYYLGYFSNSKKSGNGIYLTSDGYEVSNCRNCRVYVGNFSSDNKFGKGACYDEDGNLIYYGDFLNDKPTDAYPMAKSYPAYKFQTIVYTNGNKYIGETKDGRRAGYGIFVFDNGSAWLGNWKNGIRSGSGIYLSYDASLWETQSCNGDNCTKYTSSEDIKAAAAAAAAEQQRYYEQQQQQPSTIETIGALGFGVANAYLQAKQGNNSGGNYNNNNYNNNYNNSGNYQGNNSNNASASKKNNHDCGRDSKNYSYAKSAMESACSRYMNDNSSNAGYAKADCDRLKSNLSKVVSEAAKNGCRL